MEKFGVESDDLIGGLRDEEHQLMLEVSRYMQTHEKTAEETREYNRIHSRLQQVRDKITEHDLAKSREKMGTR